MKFTLLYPESFIKSVFVMVGLLNTNLYVSSDYCPSHQHCEATSHAHEYGRSALAGTDRIVQNHTRVTADIPELIIEHYRTQKA